MSRDWLSSGDCRVDLENTIVGSKLLFKRLMAAFTDQPQPGTRGGAGVGGINSLNDKAESLTFLGMNLVLRFSLHFNMAAKVRSPPLVGHIDIPLISML